MASVGSLCTGFGGLDLAAEMALGSLEHAWHAETDPDAARVLAAHWPAVPNLGDLAAVDWARVEPVDVLTAGYPCQPFSNAGQRKGFADERAIWPAIADAVRHLRPRLVLLENVAGHLAWGFGRVVGDLATLGYDATWTCLRAVDVGAPHRRERVFVVAHPDSHPVWAEPVRQPAREPAAQPGDYCPGVGLLPTPAARDGDGRGAPDVVLATARLDSGRRNLDDVVALLPTPAARDAGRGAGWTDLEGRPLSETVMRLLPTPRATDSVKGGPNQHGSAGDLMLPAAVQPDRWGRYAAAIARWEMVMGPAPDPTEPGRTGNPRLSARFVEWLMGVPAGWVTGHCTRNAALRVLGNGVVPAQGAAAYTWLLAVCRG